MSGSAQALTEFSADLAYFDSDSQVVVTGRIYVTDDAIREERHKGEQREVRIVDLFRGITTVIDPVAGEYSQQEAFAIPRNPSLFCDEMQLFSCGYQFDEAVGGTVASRWGADFGIGEFSIGVTAWYDPDLQYPIRIEVDGGGIRQLSQVEVGRLPSSLFTIPFDVKRVDHVEGVRIEHLMGWN